MLHTLQNHFLILRMPLQQVWSLAAAALSPPMSLHAKKIMYFQFLSHARYEGSAKFHSLKDRQQSCFPTETKIYSTEALTLLSMLSTVKKGKIFCTWIMLFTSWICGSHPDYPNMPKVRTIRPQGSKDFLFKNLSRGSGVALAGTAVTIMTNIVQKNLSSLKSCR